MMKEEEGQKSKEEEEKLDFSNEVEIFIDHMESLYQTSPTVNLILRFFEFASSKKVDEFVKDKGFIEKDEEGNEVTKIDYNHLNKWMDLTKKQQNSKLAYSIIQRNFIVSFVSQFDAYIGSLIRKMFLIKPELLNSSEKNLSFSKLSEFNSVSEAQEYIIEKEIESVLRDSHANQFKWLENKLGIPLTKDLPSWKNFIEITERRNLFVHSNGVISSQYLSVCEKHSVEVEKDVKSGQKLSVDDDYIIKAYCCLFEIGVKLSQVIWRKLLPHDIGDADDNLNDVIYKLLRSKDYELAIKLSEFATSILKKHSSQEFKLIFEVNKAQSYKWAGKEENCIKMMKGMDWSAMSDKFKLAKAVLLDDYKEVYKLMKKIGDDEDELPREGYQEWPLFTKIREEDEFKKLFKEIYKDEYEYVQYDDNSLLRFGVEESNNGEKEKVKKKKLPPTNTKNEYAN